MARRKLRLGVLASGRGSNLKVILESCRAGKMDAMVEVVVSDRSQSNALEVAEAYKIESIFLNPKDYSGREDYDAALAAMLQERRIDLVVLAGYMRLIGLKFILPFKKRIINIHPSLLPAFPGLQAHKKALEWGVRIVGCTVHFVDETMDQGPIIIQAAVPVSDDDTEEALAARVLEREHRILPQAIQYIAEDRLEVADRRVRLKSPKPLDPAEIVAPPIEIGS